MKIAAGEIYHIYNQGNNRETIFYSHENYITFLQLYRKFIFPFCKTLAYCLMPNHYHFLIYATSDSERVKRLGNIDTCELSNGFRLLQSTYASYINRERTRTGSLFKQKAQAKSMHDGGKHYELIAFRYIHQNPAKDKLVKDLRNWPYSSYGDYANIRNGTLCDKELAATLIGFDIYNFVKELGKEINENEETQIFYRRDKW